MSNNKLKLHFEGEYVVAGIMEKEDGFFTKFSIPKYKINNIPCHHDCHKYINQINKILSVVNPEDSPLNVTLIGHQISLSSYQTLQHIRHELEQFQDMLDAYYHSFSTNPHIENQRLPKGFYNATVIAPGILDATGYDHVDMNGHVLVDYKLAHQYMHPTSLVDAERLDNYYLFDVYDDTPCLEFPEYSIGAYGSFRSSFESLETVEGLVPEFLHRVGKHHVETIIKRLEDKQLQEVKQSQEVKHSDTPF